MSLAAPRIPTETIAAFWSAGRPTAIIRPVLPQDHAIVQAFVRCLRPASRYLRFQTGLRELPSYLLDAFTRLDYGRRMALIAVIMDDGGEAAIGDARYGIDPQDPSRAEIGIVVAEAWRRRGLATALLEALLRHAGRAGVAEVYGEVLAENLPTLRFAAASGFALAPDPDDRRLVRIVKRLLPPAGLAARSPPADPCGRWAA